MVSKLDDMEDKLNEQIDANVALSAQMSGFQRDAILADVSWDLSEAAKEKLAGLSESVEFESESNFRQKLNILKSPSLKLHLLPLLPKFSPSLLKLLHPPLRKVCPPPWPLTSVAWVVNSAEFSSKTFNPFFY